jgi:lipoprotein-anchoring transpeptidase ErfK/SrfK
MYLYDFSHEDEIAKGVSVNGVDLGGLTPEEARTKVRSSFLGEARAPVIIEAGRKTFRLSAHRARVSIDVDSMVDEARSRSRDGNFISRTWRQLTGEEAKADLRPTVTYSSRVVDSVVNRVRRKVDRPARDAAVYPTPTRLYKVRARSGLAVRPNALRAAIGEALVSPSQRRVVADLIKTRPKVTGRQLAARYPTYLTVSKDQTKLRFWRKLKLVKAYPVAVGMPGYPTSDGLFQIQNKQVNPTWSVPNSSWAGSLAGSVIPGGSPDNPLKARWMGFNGAQGFHGTAEVDSLGTGASHGCIRMLVGDIVELYKRVDVGTPVFIG